MTCGVAAWAEGHQAARWVVALTAQAAFDPGDGQAWGGDDEGAAFGSAYLEVAEAVRPAVTAVLRESANPSKGLAESADAYEATDTGAASSFARLTGH